MLLLLEGTRKTSRLRLKTRRLRSEARSLRLLKSSCYCARVSCRLRLLESSRTLLLELRLSWITCRLRSDSASGLRETLLLELLWIVARLKRVLISLSPLRHCGDLTFPETRTMKSRTKRWMRLNEWSRVRIRRLIKGTGAGTRDRAQGTQ